MSEAQSWFNRKLEFYGQGRGGNPSLQLLGYSETNRYVNKKLVLCLAANRAMAEVASWGWLEKLCDDVELYQLTLNGYSRSQFIEGLKAEFGGKAESLMERVKT